MENKSPVPSEVTAKTVYKGETPVNNGTIALPVHLFDLSVLKDEKIKKLFFQFEVSVNDKGEKVFCLVAYPAMKSSDVKENSKGQKGKWEIGPRLELPVKKDSKPVELPLPLTLGNLELSRKEIQELQEKEGILTLTPTLYTENAHATYTLTDGVSVNGTTAHPSPPAPPYDGDDTAAS